MAATADDIQEIMDDTTSMEVFRVCGITSLLSVR